MKNDKLIVDLNCESRGIIGELHFDKELYDELEIMEVSEMLIRVIESWCSKRDFVYENLCDYNIAIN